MVILNKIDLLDPDLQLIAYPSSLFYNEKDTVHELFIKEIKLTGKVIYSNNIDGNPRFQNKRRSNFNLKKKSRAINTGSPEEEFNDLDGTRNDTGFTGGPTPLEL